MRCLNCDYSLAGLTELRCPECGRPFDPYRREAPVAVDDLGVVMAVWLVAITCLFGLPWMGIGLAGGGHGWGTAALAGLAAVFLIPLTVIAWHLRRRANGLTVLAAGTVLGADVWVIWSAVAGEDAPYFRKSFDYDPAFMIWWLVAWFAWQILLLPPIVTLLRSAYRRFTVDR